MYTFVLQLFLVADFWYNKMIQESKGGETG